MKKFDLTIVFILRRKKRFWLKELLRCFNTRKRNWKNKGSGYAFGMPTGKNVLKAVIKFHIRPVKAVDHFLRWKDVIDVPVIRSKYYPNMTKAELFRQGFIAPGNSSMQGSSLTFHEKISSKESSCEKFYSFE